MNGGHPAETAGMRHAKDGENMEEPRRKPAFRLVLRILLFLALLAAILGLLLIALTGADPAQIREDGLSAFFQQAAASFSEEAPRERPVADLTGVEGGTALAVLNESLLLCTTGELRCLDAEGTEQWVKPVDLASPSLSVQGRDVLYADLAGNRWGIVRDGVGFFEKQAEHPIRNAFLSRDYALLLEKGGEAGYSAILEGLSREGAPVFTSYITDYTPFLVRHDPETGQNALVLSGLSTADLQAGGAVEFLAPDMTRLGGVAAQDDLYAIVLQLANGSTALVGERGVKLVDREFLAVGAYDPEGNPITAATLLDGASPVVAVLDGKRYETTRQEKSWIRVLDATGRMQREFVVEGRVRRLINAPNCIGVQTAQGVQFLDAAGAEITAFHAKSAVQNVVLTHKGLAYIQADGAVTALRVKERKRFLGLF